MRSFTSCKEAIAACLASKRFAIARLSSEEKPMDMHIHDCYELYYSLSGGKQFFVDSHLYEQRPGDLFVINPYEAHKPVLQEAAAQDRITISIHPEFLERESTHETDLAACFTQHPPGFSHQVHLTADERLFFTAQLERLENIEGFGADLLENLCFLETMVFVAGLYAPQSKRARPSTRSGEGSAWVSRVLSHINARITEPLSIDSLAEAFFVSSGYLCRAFKRETGTTISKYVSARRISLAKRLLCEGYSVHEACERCGFNDYAHFIRVFGQAVGLSPKQYALKVG